LEGDSLERVAAEVLSCTKCPLHKGRTRAVPGEGPPHARVMFIGEAPGREEDKQGRPFVGKAGQLLTEALEEAGLRREQVFITNVVKCRPPGNREPTEEEAEACRPYLMRQIALLRPEVICLLGSVATRSLLGEASVSSLRGRFIEREGRRYYVTLHPAAAIYNPGLKSLFKGDIRRLAGELGAPRPRGAQKLEEFFS